ncbi:type I-E CRISPR-associated protein Cas5/CasD [Methylobacterium nodulans]|uniref:CRISPR-associated protein Cas5 family n=1 Tax=Methylobacterium nodulans (strain LMG 21967 / CNCM I-2342 / ORS 2060) TaxID=460265 RepID=B8IMR2_METNO|nr:type I-E CRISPR-associated protein Cas5/CasD [Methylobacterium nodulans]ACL60255.1 CRISPR-associated protein Cas5 family [Methylobacterium nodulans ORS 2060]
MPAGLVFTLYAPFAGMGDVAVGEERGSFDRPARSAVLGLVAGALGIDRADEAGHAALDRGYRLALRLRTPGCLVEDYHTVQAPPVDRKARWATRREALAVAGLNTLVSRRAYRADPIVDVVLIHVDEGPTPEALATALRRPTFAPYLGRKSCPLGLPLRPLWAEGVTRVGSLLAALDETFVTHDALDPEPTATVLDVLRRAYDPDPDRPAAWPLYADVDLAGRGTCADMLSPEYEVLRIERRRDRVASRGRWQFALREEAVAVPRRNGSESAS